MPITKIPSKGLIDTGVVEGTYGSTIKVPVITLNTQGQVVSVTDTTIAFPAIPATGASAGTYGSSSKIPVFTVNASGQITSVTEINAAVNASVAISPQVLTPDGTTATFALTAPAASPEDLLVTYNGVIQESINFAVSGGNIIFTTPPAIGSRTVIRYIVRGTVAVSGNVDAASTQTITGLKTFNAGIKFGDGTAMTTVPVIPSLASYVDFASTQTITGSKQFPGIGIGTAAALSGAWTGGVKLGSGYSIFWPKGTNTKSVGILTNGSDDNLYFAASTTDASGGTVSYPFIMNMATGLMAASGNVSIASDIRLKTNLTVIPNSLEKVMQLTGYTFTRTDLNIQQTGLIAQDVQKVLPEAVDQNGDYLAVAYGNLVGLLVEAIKELKSEIDVLKNKLS